MKQVEMIKMAFCCLKTTTKKNLKKIRISQFILHTMRVPSILGLATHKSDSVKEVHNTHID